jgi:hypothetical protein
MGFFDSLTDVFTGAPAKKAAEQNKAALEAAKIADTNTLNTASTNAQGVLDQASGMYAPLSAKYGKASNLALDALGVNGAGGNANAVNSFQAGPGYQYAVDQSLEGVKRAANASGDPLGGNTLAALSDRAGNMANQEYGNWLTRLQGYTSPELAATGGQAGYTAAKAPVITGTAGNIVGIDQNTVKGTNDQTTQAANAQMAGSKNLWGAGLNLASLAAGIPTGGVTSGISSLLGGGQTQTNPYGNMPKVGSGW